MTDERKNELWAMLTPEERSDIREWYAEDSGSFDFDEGYDSALEAIFGLHNLTAQAEDCTKPTENVISDSKIQSESAESVDTNTNSQTNSQTVKNVDYAAYRLDLAKDIALTMVGNEDVYGGIASKSVSMANEIVKRLKETEI